MTDRARAVSPHDESKRRCTPPPPRPAPVKGAGAEAAYGEPPPPLRGRAGVGGASEECQRIESCTPLGVASSRPESALMHLRLERRSTTPAWLTLALPLIAI